jgi:hypothetical protein
MAEDPATFEPLTSRLTIPEGYIEDPYALDGMRTVLDPKLRPLNRDHPSVAVVWQVENELRRQERLANGLAWEAEQAAARRAAKKAEVAAQRAENGSDSGCGL